MECLLKNLHPIDPYSNVGALIYTNPGPNTLIPAFLQINPFILPCYKRVIPYS